MNKSILIKNEYPTLFLIIFLGTALRFILLPTTVWFGDPARDLLVTQHMVLYHEIPHIGHVASGLNPVFYYPPLYYYLLAVIQLVSTNIWYVLSVFVVLNILGIVAFYLIGKELSNPLGALIATTLFTFSPYYLNSQTTLTSMHFSLPFFLTGTFFYLRGIQKRKFVYVLLGLFFIVIAAVINYAALILIPAFILWTIIRFRHDLIKPILLILFVYTLLIGIFSSFAAYIISHYGVNTLFRSFYPLNNITLNHDFVSNFVREYRRLLSTIFPGFSVYLMLLMPLAIVLLFFSNVRKKLFSFGYLLSFIVLTLCLSSIKAGTIDSYYYYLIAPFIFLLIGMSVAFSWGMVRPLLVSIIVLSLSVLATLQNMPTVFRRSNSYRNTERVVDSILSELAFIRQHGYKNVLFMPVVLSEKNADWESTAYYYFFERKLGKLVRVYDYYNNLQWIGGDDYIVMICLTGDKTTLFWCNRYFLYTYPNFTFVKYLVTPSNYPVELFKNNSEEILKTPPE